MASIPYFLRLQGVIAVAGGVSTVSYQVPALQTLHINKLIYTSTGLWGFYSIRNTNGRQYTNASQAIPLLSQFFQQGASPNIGVLEFPYELVIIGSDGIFFDIIDMSAAANTVQLMFAGSLDLGG